MAINAFFGNSAAKSMPGVTGMVGAKKGRAMFPGAAQAKGMTPKIQDPGIAALSSRSRGRRGIKKLANTSASGV